MPTAWDSYKADVLDPARKAGNRPPADLFARYGITGAHKDPALFTARVDEVVRYWKTQKTVSKVYQALVEAMLVAHDELVRAKALSYEEFGRRRQAGRAEAVARLDARVATIARGIPYLTKAALAHLVQQSGLSEKDVRDRLSSGGVTVIEPEWDVPERPADAAAIALPPKLRMLGLRISPEVVFGDRVRAGFTLREGFRVTGDGARLTGDVLAEAKSTQAKRKHNDSKTAADTTLTVMLQAYRAGKLDQLIRWEVAELIRAELSHGLPLSVAAEAAAEVGLDRQEALELAASLVLGTARAAEADDATAVAAALTSGNLREAERLVMALPAEAIGEEVRKRVRDAADTVADLVARAGQAADQGRSEEAAALLSEALRRAADDPELTARLSRIPPPPPPAVSASASGPRVSIRWDASPARTGEIRYRTVRHAGVGVVAPADGDFVADGTANHATDADPPVGNLVVYTVFAVRGDGVSPAAHAEPVVVLPAVTGLALSTDGTAVTGTWQLHPDAHAVEVTRRPADDDTGGLPVPTGPGAATGFTDTGAALGAGYAYAVRALYIGDDGIRRAGPVAVATIVVEAAPAAVTDLSAEVVGDVNGPRLRLAWTAPASGLVEIRRSGSRPPWSAGEAVPVSVVDGWGETVSSGRGPGPDGRATVSVPAGQGRFVVAAVSRGGGAAIGGNTVELETAAEVNGLRTKRYWDTVRVSWLWPAGIHEARVTWKTPDRSGELQVTYHAYQRDGGLRLKTGPGAVQVTVRSVVRDHHAELTSPPVTAREPARRPCVAWDLLTSRFGRRRTLRLRPEQSCLLPELILIPGSGPAPAARIPPRSLVAGQLAEIDVTGLLPAAAVAGARCELAEPDAEAVILTRGDSCAGEEA